MRQLLHHGQTEDWLLRRMHQHVNANQTEIEFALLLQHSMNIALSAAERIG
jgi:hypothetical protein